MIRTISDIKKAQASTNREISKTTTRKFKRHIYYLNKQYDLLSEFLTNFFEYGNMVYDDSTEFTLCFSLLNESLRKQKIATKLVTNGHYDEAAELIRHIMQTCFSIIHLSKNKDSWKDWEIQQKYEEEKLVKDVKNPGKIFNNFRDLLKSIGEENQYKTFQKLSSWSHPSIESIRSNFELSKEPAQKFYSTQRYNEEKAEYFLSVLYCFINRGFWEGFKDLFRIEGDRPKPAKQYKRMQEKVTKVFDKIYAS